VLCVVVGGVPSSHASAPAAALAIQAGIVSAVALEEGSNATRDPWRRELLRLQAEHARRTIDLVELVLARLEELERPWWRRWLS